MCALDGQCLGGLAGIQLDACCCCGNPGICCQYLADSHATTSQPLPHLARPCTPAVADILGEAAAQRDWSVQEMLLEAAKLEVAAAAQAAEAGAAGGAESDAESAGYESALADDDAASFLSASPGSARSGSL